MSHEQDPFHDPMPLTFAAWRELRDQLDIAERFIPGAERRVHPRIDFAEKGQAIIAFPSDDTDDACNHDTSDLCRVWARNVSASGLGFIYTTDQPRGTRITVWLEMNDGASQKIDATVARSELVTPGLFDIGVRFDETINPQLLAHLEPAGTSQTA